MQPDEPLRRTVPVSEDNARAAGGYAANAAASEEAQREAAEREDRRKVAQAAMKRWQLVVEADQTQRAQELEDLQFDRGRTEDHWAKTQIDNRRGAVGEDGVPVTERPCLVVNKLDQPVQQVINEGRQSRLSLVVKPRPGAGSAKAAEIRQGMLRAIEVDSNAHGARMWAYERAVKCGRGYYRVEKKFANDGDFLVDLVPTRIKNQGSVYVDPYHSEPDASDMTFAFITEDIPKDEYRARYPADRHDILTSNADEFTSFTDRQKDWLTNESVRVAEHFWVETAKRWLVSTWDAMTGAWGKGSLMESKPNLVPNTMRVREVEKRTVKWCLMNCIDVIEQAEWSGRFIPVIQVIGKEYNVDGKSSYKGVITNSKDAQRIYNYAVSAEVEAVALAPRAPFIAAYGQIERYKRTWDQANVRNFTYLPYTPMAAGGFAVPAPQRNTVEPAIGAIATLVQQANDDIQSTTGRFSASLGNISPNERSGKALRELKMQAELGSSNYLENLATAIRQEGRILIDLFPSTYVEKGRIVRLVGDSPGEDSTVMLNAPFVKGPNGPEPPPTGAMAYVKGMVNQFQGKPQPEVQHYDLTAADEFMVVVDVGPSYKTQREENVAFLQSILEADPNLSPAITDIMAEEMGGPMGRKLAKRIRAMNPNLPKDDEQAGSPEQLEAEVMQLKMQMQQMEQALQEAAQAVQTQEAKQKAMIEVARFKAEADVQVKRMDLQGKMAQISAKITSDEERDRFDAAMAIAMQNDQQQHEVYMQGLDTLTRQIDGEAAFARDRAAAGQDHERSRGASREDHDLQRQAAGVDHARTRLAASDDATRGELTASDDHRRSRAAMAVDQARSAKDSIEQRHHETNLAKLKQPKAGPKS